MRLLADFHHSDLFEAHQLTLGDRLGFEVFAPYGMQWFDSWTWQFEKPVHGDAVARQYLLGIWQGAEPDANGIVAIPDTRHPGRILRGITYDAAMAQRWDFVLSSVPANAPGFRTFAQSTGAQWLVHVGNQWGDEAWGLRPDAAIITTTSVVPTGIPHVVVHQEFRLTDFRFEPPEIIRRFQAPYFYLGPIRSFVNCFPEMTSEYQGNFVPTAALGHDFEWQVYGAYGTAPIDRFAAGNLSTNPAEGDAMRGAGAIWHSKHWSDGFGHVVHRAFAVGRPVFGYQRYYADKLAGPLWEDGVTSFDVERRSREEVVNELRRLRDDPDHYLSVCEAAAKRFRDVVDFEEDADKVARLLGVAVAA